MPDIWKQLGGKDISGKMTARLPEMPRLGFNKGLPSSTSASPDGTGIDELKRLPLVLSTGETVYVGWRAIRTGFDQYGNAVEYWAPVLPWNMMSNQSLVDLYNNIYVVNTSPNTAFLENPDPEGEPLPLVPGGVSRLDYKAVSEELGIDFTSFKEEATAATLVSEMVNRGIDPGILAMPDIDNLMASQVNIAPIGDPKYLDYIARNIEQVKKHPEYASIILSKIPGAPQPEPISEWVDKARAQTAMNMLNIGPPGFTRHYGSEKEYQEAVVKKLEPEYQKYAELEKAGIYNRGQPSIAFGQETGQAAGLLMTEYELSQKRLGELGGGAAEQGVWGVAAEAEHEEAEQEKGRQEMLAFQKKKKAEWDRVVAWTKLPQRRVGL